MIVLLEHFANNYAEVIKPTWVASANLALGYTFETIVKNIFVTCNHTSAIANQLQPADQYILIRSSSCVATKLDSSSHTTRVLPTLVSNGLKQPIPLNTTSTIILT